MKKVITYGTYDLFHQGHYNLLKRAKALGDYLIVGVTTDSFDLERGKMNTCNNVMERIEAVKSTGLADQIVIEEYRGQKIDDIQKYGVDIFAIGSDWEGYFDYLNEFCKVIYLPRTQGISSTLLRQKYPIVNIGIIGTGSIASRFVPESKNVNSASVSVAYNPNQEECVSFCEKFLIPIVARDLEELYENCDAVYIASPHYTHYEYAKSALNAGKPVLCETPFISAHPDWLLSLFDTLLSSIIGTDNRLFFYLNGGHSGVLNETGVTIGMFFNLTLFCVSYFLLIDKKSIFLYNILFIGITFFLLFNSFGAISERIASTCYVANIFILPSVLNLMYVNKWRFLCLAVILLYGILMFNKEVSKESANYIPFTTIFSM